MGVCTHPAYSTRISARKAAKDIGGKARPVRCEACGRWRVVAT